MTQTIAHKPTQTSQNLATCASCPYFNDFQERSGRGWCKIMDTVARKQHKKSQVCEWEIAHYEQGSIVSELPSCPYEIGQLVKVIEPGVADSRQWQIFVVVGKKYNPERYRSISAYLEETSWYFALKAIEETPQSSSEIWVAEARLCNAGGSRECQYQR